MEMRIMLGGAKRVAAEFEGFRVDTDQPKEHGGGALHPAPFDLFLASIGTCAGFFVQSFCQARKIPTDGIEILQRIERDSEKHRVNRITLEIALPEAFPAKYRAGVVNAANLCSVKRHLQEPPEIAVVARICDGHALAGVA